MYKKLLFRNGIDSTKPELVGLEESDLLKDFNGMRQTWESYSLISSSVKCSMHGQLSSISNSINSSIQTGSRVGGNESQSSSNYPVFCNISNSLGSSIKASNYSSIFNGFGNEISATGGTKIGISNSTVLNGNKNKILSDFTNNIELTDYHNNTYSTILNGLNNTIHGKQSTIINGTGNILSGNHNLAFGENNIITADTYSNTSVFSFMFGEDNSMSGTSFTTQTSRQDGNYIFGRKNRLESCSSAFVVGGHKFDDAGDQILPADDNKFTSSYDFFAFNFERSTLTNSNDSAVVNATTSSFSGLNKSSTSNIDASNISGFQSSSFHNAATTTVSDVTKSSINNTTSCTLSDIRESCLLNLTSSNISGASHSLIRGVGLEINNDFDYSSAEGNNIELEDEKINVSYSKIFGSGINFTGVSTARTYTNCDIFGKNIDLSVSTATSYGNLFIRGNNIEVTGSSDSFIFGRNINAQDLGNSVLLGRDIESSETNTLVFGTNITSTHKAGSVIKDSKTVATQSKGKDTLFLDFDSGTYLNLPSGDTSNTTPNDGVPGSLMHSGEFLLIKTGDSGWGKVQVSALV